MLRALYILLSVSIIWGCGRSKPERDEKPQTTDSSEQNPKEGEPGQPPGSDPMGPDPQNPNNPNPQRNVGFAVLGDSISTGILADMNIGDPMSDKLLNGLKTLFPTASEFINLFRGQTSVSLDQIQETLVNPELNAFTGKFSWTHLNRLKAETGGQVTPLNMAKIGAVVAQAGEQLTRLEQQYKTGNVPVAKRVVFEFGANDFCLNTGLTQFASEFKQQLNHVVRLHPGATIVVTAIPDILQIDKVVDGNTDAATVPKSKIQALWPDIPTFLLPNTLSCSQIKRIFDYCTIPATQRNGAQNRLRQMNEAIAEAVNDAQAAADAGTKVVYVGEVGHASAVTRGRLAADCFHPNVTGHNHLSDVTWKKAQ